MPETHQLFFSAGSRDLAEGTASPASQKAGSLPQEFCESSRCAGPSATAAGAASRYREPAVLGFPTPPRVSFTDGRGPRGAGAAGAAPLRSAAREVAAGARGLGGSKHRLLAGGRLCRSSPCLKSLPFTGASCLIGFTDYCSEMQFYFPLLLKQLVVNTNHIPCNHLMLIK